MTPSPGSGAFTLVWLGTLPHCAGPVLTIAGGKQAPCCASPCWTAFGKLSGVRAGTGQEAGPDHATVLTVLVRVVRSIYRPRPEPVPVPCPAPAPIPTQPNPEPCLDHITVSGPVDMSGTGAGAEPGKEWEWEPDPDRVRELEGVRGWNWGKERTLERGGGNSWANVLTMLQLESMVWVSATTADPT